jgi:DNA-binding transcriptional ArsR family regulator
MYAIGGEYIRYKVQSHCVRLSTNLYDEGRSTVTDGNDSATDLLTLLGDEHVQAMLRATTRTSMSASMLTETCDASRATIYRRIDDLLEHDLLIERLEIDGEGNHYKVYEANLEHVAIHLDDGEFEIQVTRREDAADRLSRIWEELRGGEN